MHRNTLLGGVCAHPWPWGCKDEAVPLSALGLRGRAGTCLLLGCSGWFLGSSEQCEHLQQCALGRAFLVRVSWQFFHANKIVSAMGSSGLNDKESKARARIDAEAAGISTDGSEFLAIPSDEENGPN